MARAVAPACRSGIHRVRMLVLPPVVWLPYSSPYGACSMRTCSQSASSSSVTIIASAVREPCPISQRGLVNVTVLSGLMRT